MPRVRVKICGVQDPATAEAAATAGADAVGLVFAESRRRVTVAQATAIARALPPFVAAVGVFVDAPLEEVLALAHGVPLDAVQLHGEESPEEVEALRAQGLRVIKAVRVGEEDSAAVVRAAVERFSRASAILLDSRGEGVAGGSGRPFPWAVGEGLSARMPVIVSGGLRAETVPEALTRLRPYGVDVSSGVERDGRKDPEAIRAFVAAVRAWECAQR
ncbi:MAG: phosphoribosylanthranilate isomerase [Armatimonadota bacterium]|nr:phosphoribosylanthranilate isomerase [Armatimonadota bacterium]MDR7478707.1 phosphoribosylanthranilate isomerase [Armatimonadota bacterium]MDR7487965.1 phosphoribosylanthranilate isomerase [Armatimonadota bacterium]MDR7502981.1 phosphoribosylanthranilate isomerase [Armatimonadota bacterium]MDR7528397.1 phosphoribosylanthranilate isomerase [Armatimonadota bacterium]